MVIHFIDFTKLFDFRDLILFVLILGYPLLISLYIIGGGKNEK